MTFEFVRTALDPTFRASPRRKQVRSTVVLVVPKIGDRSRIGAGKGLRRMTGLSVV